MFGYVKVNRAALSEENLQVYQSYYCGLCRYLKSNYGVKGQVFLNYDMTFLILLLTGLYEVEEVEQEFVCRLHPLHKKRGRESEIFQYAADMNVILAYYKLMDDWKDDKKLDRYILATGLVKTCKSIQEKYPRQTEAIRKYIERQSALEDAKESDLDLLSGLTGEMLGELLVWKEDEWQRELRCLGSYLGKFIYVMDAYEDLEEDMKKRRYNPLVRLKEQEGERFEGLCKQIMTRMMAECARSFERLPILMHGELLRNILYSGVWSRYEILQLKRNKKKRV